MNKSKGNTTMVVVAIVAVAIAVIGIVLAAYVWGKNKGTTQTKVTATPTDAVTVPPSGAITTQVVATPQQVVESFMNYTLGTLPSASLDYNAARDLLTEDLNVKYQDDSSFAPLFYGIQDGPTSVEIVSENMQDSDASVKVNAFWGEMGQGWVFSLVKVGNLWLISDFRSDVQ